MEIVSECNLAKIVSELIYGKVLVFPTETSYGLGCDATNQTAVNNVFAIKGRPDNKPLLVVVPSIESAKKIMSWNSEIDKIANKYWPGSLTVVADAASPVPWLSQLARGVVSEEGTVAVRVTTSPLLRAITEKLGRPLVATSANYSTEGDNYSAKSVVRSFEKRPKQPDLILDQGELPRNQPTTVVRVYEDRYVVLRQGEVKISL